MDTQHELQHWRVLYRAPGSDDQDVFRCQAEDASHAIEQATNAWNGSNEITGVLREDAFEILPTSACDFELAEPISTATKDGTSAWLLVGNVSLRICHDEDQFSVVASPYGDEMTTTAIWGLHFAPIAEDTLFGENGRMASNETILANWNALDSNHRRQHLARLTDIVYRARLRGLLGFDAVGELS